MSTQSPHYSDAFYGISVQYAKISRIYEIHGQCLTCLATENKSEHSIRIGNNESNVIFNPVFKNLKQLGYGLEVVTFTNTGEDISYLILKKPIPIVQPSSLSAWQASSLSARQPSSLSAWQASSLSAWQPSSLFSSSKL